MTRSLSLFALLALPAVALAGFNASSSKMPSRSSGSSPWGPSAALDSNPATAWQIDPEKDNAGSWIELDVPKGKVDKVSVIVGWTESDTSWADHARLKAGRIEVYTLAGAEPKLVHEEKVTFEDKVGWQQVDLPDPEVGDELSGGRVRLVVTEVYDGKDYANLALGEILVHLGEFDVQTVKMQSASSEQDGHDAAMLIDDSTRSYWLSAEDDEAPTFTIDGGRYSISRVGLRAGSTTYARPKVVEITQGSASRTFEVANSSSTQWFELPALVGYTGSGYGDITVKVVERYPGSKSQAVSLVEVDFKATQLSAF